MRGRLLASLLVGAFGLTACASGSAGTAESNGTSHSGHPGGYHGRVLDRPYPIPAQSFTDTDGKAFVPRNDTTTPVTLLFFGYTHCPDLCNVVLANVAAALRGADPEVRKAVRLLFVSTDPKRDTAPVMREYLDRFDPTFVGLIAPLATIKDAAASVYISFDGKVPGPSGGYEVAHGTELTAFTEGLARVLWRDDTTVGDLRADLTRLARA